MNTMQSAFAEVGIVRTRRTPNPPKLKPYKREPVMWKEVAGMLSTQNARFTRTLAVRDAARVWGVSRKVVFTSPTYETHVRTVRA